MSNTLLTVNQITKEALRILHQKINFIGSINRAYDDSFAKTGAKIGDTLRIRLPNQYTVRSGSVIQTQDTVEEQVSLQVNTQKGVDMNFSMTDLTLSLDDFSKRILDPAISVLASAMEADAMNMYLDVYNEISAPGSVISSNGDLTNVLNGAKKLTDNLTPVSDRSFNMNTTDNVSLVNALKGLFNDPAKISKQYKEGMVANNFLGYEDVYQNTLWPRHTTGTDDGTGDYLTNGAAGNGSDGILAIDTGAGTWNKGDIFVIDGVYRVHPETKNSTGVLQQFVVGANYAGGAGNLTISPAIILTGARQNVTGYANNAALLKVNTAGAAIGSGVSYAISLGYHKDAFTFATADLMLPKGVHFAAREQFEGLSMRVVQQYDIVNDKMPCRLDVLYGYKAIRPQLACRYGFN